MSLISFVVPVFNSSEIIEELCSEILAACKENGETPEIIFVNDGSEDHSFEIISKLCESFPNEIKGIDLTQNFGQHCATLCGFEYCNGEYIVSIDDDLQFNPRQAFILLEELKSRKLDFIYGIPKKRNHSLRRFLGRMFLFWGSSLGSKKIAGASFRVIRKNIINQLSFTGDVVFIDDLLTQISNRYAYKPIDASPSRIKSRYSGKNIWRSGIRILFFYSGVPLRFISLLGFAGSAVSGIFGLYFIVKKLFFHVPIGYTSIIVTILFSASAILLGIGILGEYIHRIYKNKHQSKAYYIRERKNT
ncbi:MAG: glycosyltransferase [Bacteroidales bacterium]|nr:glycosyltransferase [Bacteroidales bacterium]